MSSSFMNVRPSHFQPEVKPAWEQGRAEAIREAELEPYLLPIKPPYILLGGIINVLLFKRFETKFSATFSQKYFNWYKYHLLWGEPNYSSTPRWLSNLITCSKLHYFNQYYQKIHVNTNEGTLKSKSWDSHPFLLVTSHGSQLSTWL